MATRHRCISARVQDVLRCYDTMNRSLRMKEKRPRKRQSFCSFVLFLTSFEFTNFLREKKQAELNQTALSVDEILLRASGMPRAGGRHQLPVFFPRTLPHTTSQRPPKVCSWHVHRIRKSHIYIQTDLWV